jgi:hypothetical protein
MKIGRIIHQQVFQLKWHFLACLGLMMALPLEEAIMNAREGEGFCATGLSLGVPAILAPLLAGLIACANVQADLDEKRYVFWRSKPVGVTSFMTIKYFVGLFLAVVLIVCPIAFGIVSCNIAQGEKPDSGFTTYLINWFMISIMAYSLCFLSNVLVRKTARAWLIGMAMACFIMLTPFMLPLNFKDVMGDVLFITSVVYMSITIGTWAIAFAVSLIAAARNWHLQTNLKGLLWTGAAAIFLLLMLFTRQVANIKVLDEINMSSVQFSGQLDKIGDKIVVNYINKIQAQIDIQNEKIMLNNVLQPLSIKEAIEQGRNYSPFGKTDKEHRSRSFPDSGYVHQAIGNQIYAFRIHVYEKLTDANDAKFGKVHIATFEKILLQCYKLMGGVYIPISTLDLSECRPEPGSEIKIAIRPIDDKLFIFVHNSYILAKLTEMGQLQVLDKKVNMLKGFYNYAGLNKTAEIPLISAEQLDIKEQIKLSIDIKSFLFSGYAFFDEYFSENSLVDIVNDKITFCRLSENEVLRYDVERWDHETIYCKIRDVRPFSVLEQMFNGIRSWNRHFVKDGKFYIVAINKLMVFDIRSERIRKLGHFERISDDFSIQDIEILNDGNILMSVKIEKVRGERDGHKYTLEDKYLYLLKNPE